MVVCTMSIPVSLSRFGLGLKIKYIFWIFLTYLGFKVLTFCRQWCQYQYCTSFHSQVICKKQTCFEFVYIVRPISSTKTAICLLRGAVAGYVYDLRFILYGDKEVIKFYIYNLLFFFNYIVNEQKSIFKNAYIFQA